MDNTGFARLTRALHSRRGAVQTLVGAGAALGLGRRAQARPRPACFVTGEKCDPNQADACCSGLCKKHKGKFKCVPAGQAFGCTASATTDVCTSGGSPCPDSAVGDCVNVGKKQSVCVVELFCGGACQSDADCIALGLPRTSRCIKQCAVCQTVGETSGCVLPVV